MENHYIDINKGFHRLSNFSPFDDEIYKSFKEAQEYAKGGSITTSAYPGQLIKVLTEDDEPRVFLIDNNYNLVSVSSSLTTDSKLSLQFNYNSGSGVDAVSIVLPEGFMINKFTIKIVEPFTKGSTISIGKYVDYGSDNIGIETIIDEDMTIIDEEAGDEFIFNITESLTRKTRIYIFLNRGTPTSENPESGQGILKIN